MEKIVRTQGNETELSALLARRVIAQPAIITPPEGRGRVARSIHTGFGIGGVTRFTQLRSISTATDRINSVKETTSRSELLVR